MLTHDFGLDSISDQVSQGMQFMVAASVVRHGTSTTPIMAWYKNCPRRGKAKAKEISKKR